MAENKYSNYKQMSKEDWGEYHPNTDGLPPDVKFWPGHLAMQTGCLQRIADATEAMAKNAIEMQKELGRWQKWYYEEFHEREKLQRSIIAYKANITRMKTKIALLKNKL